MLPLSMDNTKIIQVTLKPHTNHVLYENFLSHSHRLIPFYSKTVCSCKAAVFFYLPFLSQYPETSKLEVVLCPRRNFIMSKSIPGEEESNGTYPENRKIENSKQKPQNVFRFIPSLHLVTGFIKAPNCFC